MEKQTFLQAKHAIKRNPGKFPIVEMPSAFGPSVDAGPSRQHGTLQQFFESYMSLVRDFEALKEIEKLLCQRNQMQKDSAVNSL